MKCEAAGCPNEVVATNYKKSCSLECAKAIKIAKQKERRQAKKQENLAHKQAKSEKKSIKVKENGTCLDCCNPAMVGSSRCVEHAWKHRMFNRKYQGFGERGEYKGTKCSPFLKEVNLKLIRISNPYLNTSLQPTWEWLEKHYELWNEERVNNNRFMAYIPIDNSKDNIFEGDTHGLYHSILEEYVIAKIDREIRLGLWHHNKSIRESINHGEV